MSLYNNLVLNLIISGIPSIQDLDSTAKTVTNTDSFKPCYKWNTFNTIEHGAVPFWYAMF